MEREVERRGETEGRSEGRVCFRQSLRKFLKFRPLEFTVPQLAVGYFFFWWVINGERIICVTLHYFLFSVTTTDIYFTY